MKHYLLLLAFTLLLGSCTDTDYISNAPELEINVSDTDGILIEYASVSLFDNRDDWDEKTNKIDSLTTDSLGHVAFENLEEIQYYVYVEKDDLNNTYGTIATSDSLQVDEIRVLNIQIESIQ
ncbi:carboxypeptidase-like regulatory domain-containing protein [Labilibaculum sp.]|uniref:carboxypeptidase-like regulatory domain-containing protein n=1 Tax=Labilibaculum sp. TaxID=2060723 RepID=UPI003561B1C7